MRALEPKPDNLNPKPEKLSPKPKTREPIYVCLFLFDWESWVGGGAPIVHAATWQLVEDPLEVGLHSRATAWLEHLQHVKASVVEPCKPGCGRLDAVQHQKRFREPDLSGTQVLERVLAPPAVAVYDHDARQCNALQPTYHLPTPTYLPTYLYPPARC